MKSKKVIAVAETMPELSHYPDRSQQFDIRKSEVVQWIIQQPEILQWLFNVINNNGLIQFDPATQTWKGSTPPHKPTQKKCRV